MEGNALVAETGRQPQQQLPRQTTTDDDGNTVLVSLDIKSVKPYRTQDEYLYAMKEDLAEWFNVLYELPISVENFFENLETGVVLCQHANALQNFISKQMEEQGSSEVFWNNNRYPIRLPLIGVIFRGRVQPGTFQSRDNISNFISWCRVVLGIPDTLLFETEDLVSRKNERNVVLCILEVARRGASYGMLAPKLVQFEAEIEAEMAEDEEEEKKKESGHREGSWESDRSSNCNRNKVGHIHQSQSSISTSTARRQRPWIEVDMMSLDEMVRLILSACTCEHQFPMVRVSEGKYRFGESQNLIFLRILRNHVMVRIGGGWDTLECFLDRYDPCRCKSKDHRGTLAFASKSVTVNVDQTKPSDSKSPPSPSIASSVSSHSISEGPSQTKGSPPHSCMGSPRKPLQKEPAPLDKSSQPCNRPHPQKPETTNPSTSSPRKSDFMIQRTPSPASSQTASVQNRSTGSRSDRPYSATGGQSSVKTSPFRRPKPGPGSSLSRTSKASRSIGDLPQSLNFTTAKEDLSEDNLVHGGKLVRTSSSSTVLDSTSCLGLGATSSRNRRTTSNKKLSHAAIASSDSLHRSGSMDSTKLRSPIRELTKKTTTVNSKGSSTTSPWRKVTDEGKKTGKAGSGSQALTKSSSGKLSGVKVRITANQLLPSFSRIGNDSRASSVDISPTEEDNLLLSQHMRMTRSASLQPSASFTLLHMDEFSEFPPPAEDHDLIARAKKDRDQYSDVELRDVLEKEIHARDFCSEKNLSRPSSAGPLQGRRQQNALSPAHSSGTSASLRATHRTSTPTGVRVSSTGKMSSSDQSRVSRKDSSRSVIQRDIPEKDDMGKLTNQVPSKSTSRPRARITGLKHRPASATTAAARRNRSRSRDRELKGSSKFCKADRSIYKSLGDISDPHLTFVQFSKAENETESGTAERRNVDSQELLDGDMQETPPDLRVKPRKDHRHGPPTKIPLPLGSGDQRHCDNSSAVLLKRCDSGVDITNLSPTDENGSLQSDDDSTSPRPWLLQRNEARSLSDQKLVVTVSQTLLDEEYY